MKRAIFCILVFASLSSLAAPCPIVLSFEDATSRLISYLTTLLDHHVIGHEDVKRLFVNLEKGQLTNPIIADQSTINSKVAVHRDEIDRHLKGRIDKKKLLEWLSQYISSRETITVARETVQKKTVIPFHRMEFHEIESDGTLAYNLEIMSTPVTQKHWVDVMGENPTFQKTGDDVIVVAIDQKRVWVRPDIPVENVTWWSALAFADQMSRNAGLKPAYNLERISFDRTSSADAGDLRSVDPYIRFNVLNAHESEGYRLPHLAEIEYLTRSITKTGEQALKYLTIHVPDHAWLMGNASAKTHAVALLKPLILEGHAFHDLLGNVWEWTNDRENFEEGSFEDQGRRYLYGGNFNSTTSEIKNMGSLTRHPNTYTNGIGFRLVRTLK